MIDPAYFVRQGKGLGLRFFTGVPCSYLGPLIDQLLGEPGVDYVGAANEGDAVAIASGAELAGRRGAVLLQNSGLGNAVNPLTSLSTVFGVPVLLLVSWRGEPGGRPDEPQHEWMGEITPALLDLLGVSRQFLPAAEDEVGLVLSEAVFRMERTGLPSALVVRQGTFARRTSLPRPAPSVPSWADLPAPRRPAAPLSRSAVLRVVQERAGREAAVVATTGYTGRALYAMGDLPNQLYLVGSMGCASSVGLGLALSEPGRRVIVLDGDGAALMRLGAMATVGHHRPPNLVHLLLDNESHESTGGQATVSASADLAFVARACGYPRVVRAGSPEEVAAALDGAGDGLTFIHVKTGLAEPEDLPRPAVTPRQVAERFRAWLQQTSPRLRRTPCLSP
jgi:phosphonopyruvate decarboxylase